MNYKVFMCTDASDEWSTEGESLLTTDRMDLAHSKAYEMWLESNKVVCYTILDDNEDCCGGYGFLEE